MSKSTQFSALTNLANLTEEDLKYRYEHKIGNHTVSKIRQRAYVLNALNDNPADVAAKEILFKMLHCSASRPCKKPYCPMCRFNRQEEFSNEMLAAFSHLPASQLRFLTILHHIEYNAAAIVHDTIKDLNKKIRNLLNEFESDQNYKIQLLGAFEIEVFPAGAVLSDRKLLSLTPLNLQPTNNSPFFLLHFHAVVNLGSCPDTKLLSAFKSKGQYPNKYQVLLQPLYSTKTVSDNLSTLAKYMLKFRLQYSKPTSAVGQNQLFARTCYASLYSSPIAKSIVMLAQRCNNFNGLTFSRM
ncbi:conserved hypothetical protein [Candidatus Terasakiella magnetica]|nr:conserved hypothetical protein [Candidatus Terasakiella magnetica]